MKTCVCIKTKNYANFFLQQLELLAPGITALWNAAPREICHQHKLTIDNIFTVTFITIDHTFTISVLIKVTIHITPPWRSSSLAKFIIPLLLSPCYVRNISFRFHFYFHHGCTLILLKHVSDPRWGWFQEKIVQWKQIRDQKLNLGSTMGSFSTPNSLSQHHFLCFSAKRGRADPFPNYLTKIKEVRPIIFQDLIEWNYTIQKYEIFPFNFQRLEGFWPIFHFIKRVSFQLSPIQSNSAAAYSFQFHQSWSHATPPTLIPPLWITPKSVRLFTNSNLRTSTKSMRSKKVQLISRERLCFQRSLPYKNVIF